MSVNFFHFTHTARFTFIKFFGIKIYSEEETAKAYINESFYPENYIGNKFLPVSN